MSFLLPRHLLFLLSCLAFKSIFSSSSTTSPIAYDGVIGYFLGTCPQSAGWEPYTPLAGRLTMSLNNSFQAGEPFGLFGLEDGQDPSHSHVLSGSFTFNSKHISSVGGLNTHGAKSGAQPLLGFANVSASNVSGYAFVQLSACRYSSLSLQPPPVLPFLAMTHWDSATATNGCVAGTEPLQAASGRILVTAAGNVSDDGYVLVGSLSPLAPDADVAHGHSYTASISLGTTDYAGIDGCCDNDPTSDGEKTTEVLETAPASTGLPRLALLACSIVTNTSSPISAPSGYVMFITGPSGCPAGWVGISSNMSGRIVVATPDFGVPSRTFGSESGVIQVVQNTSVVWNGPQHSHSYEITIQTTSSGIGLDTGCCAHGYGASGTYVATGAVDSSVSMDEGTLPLFMVQACVQA